LIEVASRINLALKELVRSVDAKSGIPLPDLISNVAQETSHFITTSSRQGDNVMETRIKDTLLNLAVAARTSFKNRSDIVVRQQFKKIIEDLVAVLKEFITKYCGKYIQGNSDILTVPPFDVSPQIAPPPPPTAPIVAKPPTTVTPSTTPTTTVSSAATAPTVTATTTIRGAVPVATAGTATRTERTRTLASQRMPSKEFLTKLDSTLQKPTDPIHNPTATTPITPTPTSTSKLPTANVPLPVPSKPAEQNNSGNSIDSISSIGESIVSLFQDRYKTFGSEWKNSSAQYNSESNRLVTDLVQKQTVSKEDPIISDLVKLLTSKTNSRDWEDVEKDLKAFTRNVTQRYSFIYS
jgi:hypothetical protein